MLFDGVNSILLTNQFVVEAVVLPVHPVDVPEQKEDVVPSSVIKLRFVLPLSESTKVYEKLLF